jgi:hypothetical protein
MSLTRQLAAGALAAVCTACASVRPAAITRAEIEAKLSNPAASPYTLSVCARGKDVVPPLFAIVEDYRSESRSFSSEGSEPMPPKVFVRCEAILQLGCVLRGGENRQRIIAVLVEIAKDASDGRRARNSALMGLESAFNVPGSTDALIGIFRHLHQQHDPLDIVVLEHLTSSRDPQARQFLQQLTTSDEAWEREKATELLKIQPIH